MLNQAPAASRLHIGLFGRRNVGKSSLINAITGQQIALVSGQPGTTTDPVYKSMEILPIGPVMFMDTAGLDDEGEVGTLRVNKTRKVMDRTDVALLVFSPQVADWSLELEWYQAFKARKIPVVGVINRIDENDVDAALFEEYFDVPFVKVSSKTGLYVDKLTEAIQTYAPVDLSGVALVGDLVNSDALVVLVAPPDKQSPKGRLKLAQVQVIRDLLDHHAMALTVTDDELPTLLASLNRRPDLVIADAQVFDKVTRVLPGDVLLTSFSMVLARFKGDLGLMVEGARTIDSLKPGDKVLIAEACTHHAMEGDIARERLPQWLSQKVGGDVSITVNTGVDFPEDLGQYKLVVHCGACMFNRRQVTTRLQKATQAGVPVTNFGVAIAYLKGVLDSSLRAFEDGHASIEKR